MSIMWIVGGVYFWVYRERHWPWGENAPAPQLKDNPSISIIIPCFNEEKNVEETIHAALAQRYENIEVIAVNDGSTDKTRAILDRMAAQIPHLRVIHLAQNQGKAIALKTGAAAAKSEYLVCIDGDALLDRDAAAYIVEPMLYNPRVGAVTGNPRIRTRSTLVGKNSGWRVFLNYWFDQANPAYLWKRIYRFRCYCRISSQRPGRSGLLE